MTAGCLLCLLQKDCSSSLSGTGACQITVGSHLTSHSLFAPSVCCLSLHRHSSIHYLYCVCPHHSHNPQVPCLFKILSPSLLLSARCCVFFFSFHYLVSIFGAKCSSLGHFCTALLALTTHSSLVCCICTHRTDHFDFYYLGLLTSMDVLHAHMTRMLT